MERCKQQEGENKDNSGRYQQEYQRPRRQISGNGNQARRKMNQHEGT